MPKPIDQMGRGPKREVKELPGGTFEITVTPPAWSGFTRGSTMVLTADQYRRYLLWRDGPLMIQHALPELSMAQREMLQSGITPEDWDNKIKDPEE